MKIHYSFLQKLSVLISQKIMPIIDVILPSDLLITYCWKFLWVKMWKRSIIKKWTVINAPFMVSIWNNCIIHGNLKSRWWIYIWNRVQLIEGVMISTQSHNINSWNFEAIYKPVNIWDNCWLSLRTTILQWVTLAKWTVVAAWAVVTKSSSENDVLGWIPAKVIKKRMCK